MNTSDNTTPPDAAAQPPEPHQAAIDALIHQLTPVIGVIANMLVRHPEFLQTITHEVLARLHGPTLMNADEAATLLASQSVELTKAPIEGVSALCGILNGPHHPRHPDQIVFMIYREGHHADGSHGMVWEDLPNGEKMPDVVLNAFRVPGIEVGTPYYINFISPVDQRTVETETKALGAMVKELSHEPA